MKNILSAFLVVICCLSFSCKKCSTCTYTDSAKAVTTTSEFCSTGHVYKNQLDQYEKSGWKCVDK